jgi:hypothetical protein
MTAMPDQRVTLKQHREILVQAGWVALLVGCVGYDTGNRQAAETTRQAALSLTPTLTMGRSSRGHMRCGRGST